MSNEITARCRRNTVLATVIGTVLVTYAGSATALESRVDVGGLDLPST